MTATGTPCYLLCFHLGIRPTRLHILAISIASNTLLVKNSGRWNYERPVQVEFFSAETSWLVSDGYREVLPDRYTYPEPLELAVAAQVVGVAFAYFCCYERRLAESAFVTMAAHVTLDKLLAFAPIGGFAVGGHFGWPRVRRRSDQIRQSELVWTYTGPDTPTYDLTLDQARQLPRLICRCLQIDFGI